MWQEVDKRRVEVEHKSERRRGEMNECPCSEPCMSSGT